MANMDTISPPMVKMNIVLNYTEHGLVRLLTVKNEQILSSSYFQRWFNI